jgi:Ca2+-transporting ATPase
MAVIYLPAMQTVFRTEALPLDLLVICLLLSTVVFWVVEAEKLYFRRKGNKVGIAETAVAAS